MAKWYEDERSFEGWYIVKCAAFPKGFFKYCCDHVGGPWEVVSPSEYHFEREEDAVAFSGYFNEGDQK